MLRWLPWLVLAACGTPPSANPIATFEPPVAPADAVPVAMPAPAPPPPAVPAELVHAIPEGMLTVAAPTDGDYAVSADASGGVRLWPALDGTREPVLVQTRHAKRIATTRDGDAIVIAVVDPIGELELVRVAADGRPLERHAVDLPRPAIDLAARTGGFVVARDDQKVALLDPHGELRAELELESGERLDRLVAANDHVLAVMAARGARRGARWIDSAGWGARTARFACDGDQPIFLSPDGRAVLCTVNQTTIVLADLARGATTSVIEVSGTDPRFTHGLGFRSAATFRYMNQGAVFETSDGVTREFHDGFDLSWIATAHGAIGASNRFLVIASGDGDPKYLGYRVAALADLVAAQAGGWVATDGMSLVHLDAQLHADRTLTTPFPDTDNAWVHPITLIDETHVVIKDDQARFLYEIGRDAGELVATGYSFQFERSSNLALTDGPQQALRWNPTKHRFEDQLITLSEDAGSSVRLYDPRTNGGVLAVAVTDVYDPDHGTPGQQKIVLHEVLAIGAHPRSRDRTIMVPNEELFSGHSGPNLDTQFPAATRWAESADGTLIAELANDRITLHDRDGNLRWARTADGAQGLAWNAADELVAFGAGAALVDLETGAYHARQCGWRFGLWDRAPALLGQARICEAP